MAARVLVFLLAAAVPLSGIQPPVFASPATVHNAPAVAPVKAARATNLPSRASRPPSTGSATGPSAPVWPAAGDVRIDLPGSSGATARVGGLVVTARGVSAGTRVSASTIVSRVHLQVLDRTAALRAGASGPVLTVSRADGVAAAATVDVQLPYSTFAGVYGGDYGARLRLVRLPACALTAPERTECRSGVPVGSRNDTSAQTLAARVDLAADGPTVLAAEPGDASSQGDYKATSLSPASKWDVSLASGAMTWKYPIRVPKTPGDLQPDIALSYSSQTVDGRTAATNNQGSWIGEGFSYEPGYVERRYKPCDEDGHANYGDQCWAFANATMMLGSASGDLVKINDGLWKLSTDDGTRVERLTGAVNGDDDGEYWKATTPDGTEYYFGLNRLPGWTSGKTETNSTWTAPVSGDDSGEPCYNSSGWTDSFCDQGWRWNLDYVKDPHGNVISYFYGKELNFYAQAAKTDVNGKQYVRGGWLKEVDYGQADGAVYTTSAPARVRFDTAERCLPSGTITCAESQLSDSTAYAWPDTPFDRNCAANTHCKIEQSAESFWTRKRLTTITTEIRSGSAWTGVERWDLRHTFTDNGDGSKTLWLDKIDHTGLYGGTANEARTPAVQLVGIQLPNRVDSPTDNLAPLNRYRLSTIYTETGAQVQVNYAPTECTPSSLPTEGHSTKRCFPVKWNPFDPDKPTTDWFHKYVVAQTIEQDRTGGNPDQVTQYEYGTGVAGDQDPIEGAAWRKSPADGITKDEYRTWSEWRGYPVVTVRKGDMQTLTTRVDHKFFRGMDGDTDPAGGTRTVKISDSTGAEFTDVDDLAGRELETTVYNGTRVVSKEISIPKRWVTHTQTESWGTLTASMVKPETKRTLVALAPDAQGNPVWRETKTTTTYDTTWGRATKVDDLGDVSTAADDKCTRTSYVDNPGKYMYGYKSLVETFSVKCSTTPNRATQLITSQRASYDGGAWNAAPTKGDVTRDEELLSDDGTTTTYRKTETIVDGFGRPTRITSPNGFPTDTAYTDADGLNIRKKVTSYPSATLSYSTTTDYSPAYGLQTGSTDPNNKRADLEYDGLGRLVRVWQAIRPKSLGNSPSIKYTYLIRADKPTVVTTETLRNDGTYAASYQLLDGFLRERQTQRPGPNGGWLLSDTLYNPIGQKAVKNEPYLALGTPGDLVLVVPEGSVNGQTKYLYDGAARQTDEIVSVAGDERWRTFTSYEGDRINVDPPAGGTPTTTVSDARGNTIALYQYKGSSPSGPADVSRYTYTPRGLVETVTGPDGATWRYTYYQNGQRATAQDPDTGTTTYTYDKNGNLTSTVDGRGVKLSNVFDHLNRKTEEWKGDPGTGTKLAAWIYDSYDKGQLAGTARYVNGKTYYVTYPQRDGLYRVLRTSYIIPSDAGSELAKTYDFSQTYNVDNTVQGLGLPAGGDLAAESLVIAYDGLLRPTTLTGSTSYVTDSQYTDTGQITQNTLYTGSGKKAWQTFAYERGTNRLKGLRIDRQSAPIVDMDATYNYDAAGNVLSIVDTPSGSDRDIQCFTYDSLRRLTEAWATASTAADPCAGGDVATSGVGGPGAYHQQWTVKTSGDRDVETVYDPTTGAPTTRTYKYTAPGQPHTLRGVDEVRNGVTTQYAYDFDPAGNTTRRGTAAAPQDLTWDAEGHLETFKQGTQTTSYVYDADGNILLRKEPNATVLLMGTMELRLDLSTRKVTGTRYYQFGGRTVAVRTGSGVSFQFADAHGSNQASVDAQTGAIAWRRTTPYGGTRGAPPSAWPDQKGFLGGTRDAGSGLIHLGAREFDPALGRFVSADPVFDGKDPQSWNGYSYGNNNPLSNTDPDGRRWVEDGGDCGCGTVPLPIQHAWDNFWNNINKIQTFTIVAAVTAVVAAWNWVTGLFHHEATAEEKAQAAGVVGSEEGAEKAVDVAIELQGTREGIPKDMGTTSVVKVWDSETGQYIIKVAVETTAVKEMPAGWEEIIRKTYGSEIAIEFVKNPGTSRSHDHAEEAILGSLGDTQVVVEGGASRNVCLYQCNAELPVDINLGGREWPFRGEKTPFRAFWRGAPADPYGDHGEPIGGGDWGMTP